jgi:hypothetical protein
MLVPTRLKICILKYYVYIILHVFVLDESIYQHN